jgi:hypothetical protein
MSYLGYSIHTEQCLENFFFTIHNNGTYHQNYKEQPNCSVIHWPHTCVLLSPYIPLGFPTPSIVASSWKGSKRLHAWASRTKQSNSAFFAEQNLTAMVNLQLLTNSFPASSQSPLQLRAKNIKRINLHLWLVVMMIISTDAA